MKKIITILPIILIVVVAMGFCFYLASLQMERESATAQGRDYVLGDVFKPLEAIDPVEEKQKKRPARRTILYKYDGSNNVIQETHNAGDEDEYIIDRTYTRRNLVNFEKTTVSNSGLTLTKHFTHNVDQTVDRVVINKDTRNEYTIHHTYDRAGKITGTYQTTAADDK